MESKYFAVVAKCGHVGKGRYIPVKFAVISENGKSAAKAIQYAPRVKHDHKDAILSVEQVGYVEFCEIIKQNDSDPYLKSRSKQEQAILVTNLDKRCIEEKHTQADYKDAEARTKFFGKMQVRNPKRFFNHYSYTGFTNSRKDASTAKGLI